jgi:hypothetical protein
LITEEEYGGGSDIDAVLKELRMVPSRKVTHAVVVQRGPTGFESLIEGSGNAVFVTSVTPGGPMYAAGVRVGDAILSINGLFADHTTLSGMVANTAVGCVLSIGLYRVHIRRSSISEYLKDRPYKIARVAVEVKSGGIDFSIDENFHVKDVSSSHTGGLRENDIVVGVNGTIAAIHGVVLSIIEYATGVIDFDVIRPKPARAGGARKGTEGNRRKRSADVFTEVAASLSSINSSAPAEDRSAAHEATPASELEVATEIMSMEPLIQESSLGCTDCLEDIIPGADSHFHIDVIRSKFGFGMKMTEDLVVFGFNPLPDGGPGPVEQTGKVLSNDRLVGVNGVSVKHMNFDAVLAILSNPNVTSFNLSFVREAAESNSDEILWH